MKKSKDLESGPSVPAPPGPGAGSGALPADWQAIVKRKALDGAGEKGSNDNGNVTITERRDGAVLPTLGYGQGYDTSSLSPAYRARRGVQLVERYVDDPYTRFDGMQTRRQGYSRDRDGYSRTSRERDMRYMGDRSAYSSRSGSGSGSGSGTGSRCITPCARIRSHDHRSDRHSHHSRSSRNSKDRYDEYDYPRHSDGYFTPSRRSRSGLGGVHVHDKCDCPSYPPSRHSHFHSHSHSNDIPLGRGCVGCHRQDSSSSSSGRTRPRTPDDLDLMRHLPGPTYSQSSRPLPEPMIHSDSQTHSFDISSRASREYAPKRKSQPHRSGVLRRADSSTSTDTDAGWDLAGKGAYETSHGRGMGELYESLRRAIGESDPAPAPGPNHVRV